MPTYEYECQRCGGGFSKVMTMEELDKNKIQCPNCDSDDVTQVIEFVFVATSRKT